MDNQSLEPFLHRARGGYYKVGGGGGGGGGAASKIDLIFLRTSHHGCSELETRLRIKNIRYGFLTQLLMSSLSQSFYRIYLFRGLFLTVLTLLLKTKYTFH